MEENVQEVDSQVFPINLIKLTFWNSKASAQWKKLSQSEQTAKMMGENLCQLCFIGGINIWKI